MRRGPRNEAAAGDALAGTENWRPTAAWERLHRRAALLGQIRAFFAARGVIEVETPLLAQAPVTDLHLASFHVPLDSPPLEPARFEAAHYFLQTSPEYAMKRLLAAGSGPIYQISKAFRRDEAGRLHNPEFTLLEWYRAGISYLELMDECEEMILFVSRDLGFVDRIIYQGRNIDLSRPWTRIKVRDAFKSYASLSMEEALGQGVFDEIMVSEIEPALGASGPVFLFDYPSSLAALARPKDDDPGLSERFEIYVGGLELANAFSELTDMRKQEIRFEKEMEMRKMQGKETFPMPEKFLKSLRHMPPAVGIALGLDRLTMIFTDRSNIDDVVSFAYEEL